MRYITQHELDALAVAANGTTMPIVRAAQTATKWAGADSWYSVTTGCLAEIFQTAAGQVVNPQPDYSFVPNVSVNLIPANAVYDGLGNYAVALVQSGDYNYIQGENDTSIQDPGAVSDYIITTTNIYFSAGTVVTLAGQPGAPITATLEMSSGTMLKTMNRIRGDLLALVFGGNQTPTEPYAGAETLFKSPSALVSGPWVVGVNEPQTWDYTGSGILQGQLDGMIAVFDGNTGNPANGIMCGFKNVEFWCTAADAVGLTMSVIYHFDPGFGDTMNAVFGGGNVTRSFTIRSGITATMVILFPTQASVSGLSLTGATLVSNDVNGLKISVSIVPGNNAVSMSYASAVVGDGIPVNITDFTITGSAQDDVSVVHPTAAAKRIKQPQYTGTNECLFIGSGVGNVPQYTQPKSVLFTLSTGTVKGVWIAKTLPVPGINVYIDQDMPTFIGAVISVKGIGSQNINIAIAGNQQMDGSSDAPWASSMRQAAPVQIGAPDVTSINGVDDTKPGITTRPAKWLVRRDTDFVPYDLGFNQTEIDGATHYTYRILKASVTPGQMQTFQVSIPPNVTGVKIRLMQSGTLPGWKSGTFSYGTALATPVDIYVKKTGIPTLSSFDFKKSDGTVTIGPDGGAGYMASIAGNGFTFGVAVNGSTGASFDIYVEQDIGTPARIYTPQAGESYSYCLDGTPGIYFSFDAYQFGDSGSSNWTRVKPIPQSGYCLFKVRATRLPVANSRGISITPATGSALTVKIGQQIDNGDGTMTFTPFQSGGGDLTVTIGATASTSEDVAVFVPVLAGNEVAYQCSAQVILEVWANWQPIWFNEMYSQGQWETDLAAGYSSRLGSRGFPVTTAFQWALAFANNYRVDFSGWTPPYFNPDPFNIYNGARGSAVVFPLFGALYDDTVALLTVLNGGVTPPVLPGSQDAAGGGGPGAGGGAGSGGDPGAGGFGAL